MMLLEKCSNMLTGYRGRAKSRHFDVIPGIGAGDLRFGMGRDEVRSIVGDPESSFEKVPGTPADYYNNFIAYYTSDCVLKAIDFFEGANATVDGVWLLNPFLLNLKAMLRYQGVAFLDNGYFLEIPEWGVSVSTPFAGNSSRARLVESACVSPLEEPIG